jgi:hypothetical protein
MPSPSTPGEEKGAGSMRDVMAGLVALILLLVAVGLIATLQGYRRRRLTAEIVEREKGRWIVAEIPGGADLILFSEDVEHFYYGALPIPKASILAARVLVNGTPIAATVSPRRGVSAALQPTAFEDRPDGIARDRWDVAIETEEGVTLVACGAIRERVSQELARRVYDAIRAALDRP